ncbi:cell cycle RNA binding protein whi3 [Hypoxylon texense]
MLTAMSSGGRIGRDAPYVPRGCDMRWFDTWEVCEILGRYSQVILVGDSMLRHVIGALNILIREDLGYGGVTDWNFSEEEKQKCFCNNQFDIRDCSIQGIFSTADVIKHDPLSLVCPKMIPDWNTDLRIEQIVRFPIPDDERRRFGKEIDPNPLQRKAFVLGHGLWNNLEVDQATSWLDAVLGMIESRTGARAQLRGRSPKRNLPVLLMTPNAAGDRKPDEWLVSQGNKALVRFEHAMATQAAKRRVDHLGTWNMSVQASLYDGVHMDMRGNLVKAMMVLNWLNLLDA